MWRHFRQRDSAVGASAIAIRAAKLPDVPVQLQYVLASSKVVQSIHILGDKSELELTTFKLHQCSVAGIGLRFCDELTTPVIPLQNKLGIAPERFRGSKVF